MTDAQNSKTITTDYEAEKVEYSEDGLAALVSAQRVICDKLSITYNLLLQDLGS